MLQKKNLKSIWPWEERLVHVYFHLVGNTFPELRAVVAKSKPELLEIYFYYHGKLETIKREACGVVTCEVWDPDIGEELVSDIIRLDEPEPIPDRGVFLYRRKEPFIDPSFQNGDRSSFQEEEKYFAPLNSSTPDYLFNCFDIEAFFGEALVGNIIPSLRKIMVFWTESTILPIFVYDGKIHQGKVDHAASIVKRVQQKMTQFGFLLRIERADYPERLPSLDYEPEFEPNNETKVYTVTYFGKKIPFPVTENSRILVFSNWEGHFH